MNTSKPYMYNQLLKLARLNKLQKETIYNYGIVIEFPIRMGVNKAIRKIYFRPETDSGYLQVFIVPHPGYSFYMYANTAQKLLNKLVRFHLLDKSDIVKLTLF